MGDIGDRGVESSKREAGVGCSRFVLKGLNVGRDGADPESVGDEREYRSEKGEWNENSGGLNGGLGDIDTGDVGDVVSAESSTTFGL